MASKRNQKEVPKVEKVVEEEFSQEEDISHVFENADLDALRDD